MNTRIVIAAGLLFGLAKAAEEVKEEDSVTEEEAGSSDGSWIMDLVATMGVLDWIIVILAGYIGYAWFLRDYLFPDTSASDAAANYVIQTTAPPQATSAGVGGPDTKGEREHSFVRKFDQKVQSRNELKKLKNYKKTPLAPCNLPTLTKLGKSNRIC